MQQSAYIFVRESSIPVCPTLNNLYNSLKRKQVIANLDLVHFDIL